MAAQRFRRLRDGGINRSSKRSSPPQLSGRAIASPLLRHLDFVVAIFFLWQRPRCAGLGLARALTSAQDLARVREQSSNGAGDLSRGTFDKWWKDLDLPSSARGAAA